MPKSHFKIDNVFDCPSDLFSSKEKKKHGFKTNEVFSHFHIKVDLRKFHHPNKTDVAVFSQQSRE